jgi:hypothetical protein
MCTLVTSSFYFPKSFMKIIRYIYSLANMKLFSSVSLLSLSENCPILSIYLIDIG